MSKKLLAALAPVLAVAAFALVPATAQAGIPPTVKTGAATSASHSATLHGTVNPNGGEVTECYFEYATTTSYGPSVSCAEEVGSGTSPVEVHAEVSGLTTATTYHFRIVATNSFGRSFGSDATFKTLAQTPPTVVTEAASAVTQTSATLNGTVNPEGAAVSACKFEYGTTTSYGSTVPCSPPPGSGTSPVKVSATVKGLTANTTYHFRISATNPVGTSKSSDETFKTLAPVGSPPTVVTEAASAVTDTSATLNGSVNPNGGNVSECTFEYGTTTAYGSSASCAPAPGSGTTPVAVSASVTGLTPGTTYHFRIFASSLGGSSTGADQMFTTFACGLPHYYVNGMRLKEGSANAKTFIAWGTIALTGTKGAVTSGQITCHTVAAGRLLNPSGAGPGEGLFEQYASFSCEQEKICPLTADAVEMEGLNLPWHDLLTEEVAGTIRQETAGFKVDIVCKEGSVILSELKFEALAAEQKGPRPKVAGGTSALHPGLLEFNEGSGELECEGCQGSVTLKPTGAIKLLGYNAQELIAMKSP